MHPTSSKRSELWQRIRAARRFGQVTQAQAAQACGVSRPAIALWESLGEANRTMPSAEQMMALATLCGISPQYLMDDSVLPDAVYTYGSTESIRAPKTAPLPADMVERQAKAFWAAVRFGVIAQKPELEDAFDVVVAVGDEDLAIPFMLGEHIVYFGSPVKGHSTLTRELGLLLVYERAAAHPMRKHLFRYSPVVPAAPRLAPVFEMDIRYFDDVGEAVSALIKL